MKTYKIVDLSSLFPGPFSSHLLSRFSFEITKIEDQRNADVMRQMWPTTGGISVAYQALNKGKQIVEIDYKNDSDITKLKQNIKESDVLIENFRPGRMDKLGLSYQECVKIHPKLIYCSISGFGQNHPLSKKPAHDLNILGLSGYLSLGSKPSVPPLQIADIITAYEAALAIVTSLLDGGPARLDISMLAAITQAAILTNSIEQHIKRNLTVEEFILWGTCPCYAIYQTKDKKYMALAAVEAPFWSDFCSRVGLQKAINHQFDPDNHLLSQIQEIIASKKQEEWVREDLDCFTPIYSYLESKKHGLIK